MITCKRVYGMIKTVSTKVIVLVDRLWPRGVKRAIFIMMNGIKALAPSTELRKWFSRKWRFQYNSIFALLYKRIRSNTGKKLQTTIEGSQRKPLVSLRIPLKMKTE